MAASERASPLLAIALGTVGLVAASAVAIVLLSPGPADPTPQQELDAEREYRKLVDGAAPLVEQGRLAEAIRLYDEFLRTQARNASTWVKAKEGRDALIKKIGGLFEKDMREFAALAEKARYREALAVLERMIPYAIEDYLKEVLKERERLLERFDRQARDRYHGVEIEFRKLMTARDHAGALRRIARLPVEEGELPREWFQAPGVDYAQLAAAVKDLGIDRIFAIAEPRLLVVRDVRDVETSRLVLFDLLCAAYGVSLRRDVERGFGYIVRDGHEIRRLRSFDDRGGVPSIRDGRWFVRTAEGEELELRFETLDLEDLGNLAIRGADSDLARCTEAAKRDPRLPLKLGVVAMFTPGDASARAALAHFSEAADPRRPARTPLAELFLKLYQGRRSGQGR
jgi:hypothetical protein